MNLKEVIKRMKSLGFELDLEESEQVDVSNYVFSKECTDDETDLEYGLGVVVLDDDEGAFVEWIEVEPRCAGTNLAIPLTIREMKNLIEGCKACNELLRKAGLLFVEGYKDEWCNLYFKREGEE